MNKKELMQEIKKVKDKMKMKSKKDDYAEYLTLREERLKLESELNELKKVYFAGQAELAKNKLRKMQDHKKFIFGGLVVKYFGYIDEKELEKKLQNIKNSEEDKLQNNIKNNEEDNDNDEIDLILNSLK